MDFSATKHKSGFQNDLTQQETEKSGSKMVHWPWKTQRYLPSAGSPSLSAANAFRADTQEVTAAASARLRRGQQLAGIRLLVARDASPDRRWERTRTSKGRSGGPTLDPALRRIGEGQGAPAAEARSPTSWVPPVTTGKRENEEGSGSWEKMSKICDGGV